MHERILDFSTTPAKLSYRYRQLVIRREEAEPTSVPMEDIAAVIVSHPQISFTQAVLAGLSEAGAVFISCDQRHLPVAMAVPLVAHHVQTVRLAKQAEATLPTKKRLWKQTIQEKILAQSRALIEITGDDAGLEKLAAQVKSGDQTNVEAQAARRYWQRFFQNCNAPPEALGRKQEGEDRVNLFLNYGYSILRAIVARAIVATGLHPSLGIHHHNKYNPYCLADDLMEPFRPSVDLAVFRTLEFFDPSYDTLEPEVKEHLLAFLTGRYEMADGLRTLFEAAAKLAQSLSQVFEGRVRQLHFPGAICYAP